MSVTYQYSRDAKYYTHTSQFKNKQFASCFSVNRYGEKEALQKAERMEAYFNDFNVKNSPEWYIKSYRALAKSLRQTHILSKNHNVHRDSLRYVKRINNVTFSVSFSLRYGIAECKKSITVLREFVGGIQIYDDLKIKQKKFNELKEILRKNLMEKE